MDSTLQGKFWKALGAVKDQTSISIAKVGSAGLCEVEVALVKATSHDETPLEEKYVQELLFLTSGGREHVEACIASLEKRLRKTRNWIVAIKTLMLAHRLIRDGDSAFEHNLASLRKKGTRVLDVCAFRDEYDVHGWDFSAFVRAYGSYLDERLEFSLPSFSLPEPQKFSHKDDLTSHQSTSSSASGFDGDQSCGKQHCSRRRRRPVKKMRPLELLQKFPFFQKLLERVIECKPSGVASSNRLVLFALQPIIRESFLIFSDVRDGMAILLDAFFELSPHDCRNAFDIYSKAAKQVNQLVSLYCFCKSLGVCKTTEYPAVEKISEEMLETMEASLRLRLDSVRDSTKRSKPSQARSVSFQDELEEDPTSEDMGSKSLSPPSYAPMPCMPMRVALKAPFPPRPVSISKDPISCLTSNESSNEKPDLLDLNGKLTTPSSEQENNLFLPPFSVSDTCVNAVREDLFPDVSENGIAMPSNALKRNNEPLRGWELALIDAESDMSRPSACALAGEFDQLSLNSLYDQGMQSQMQQAYVSYPVGNACSFVSPFHPQANSHSLCAPLAVESMVGTKEMERPYAASLNVPPPPYLLSSEVWKEQQLPPQEQQPWLQYQNTTSAGHGVGPTNFGSNPFSNPFQPTGSASVPSYVVNSNYV